MPNPYKRLLEVTLRQKVSEAAEQLMKSISQEIDAELQRDMIGARIYYEDREAGERWLRMEAQKQESSAFTLRRHLKWDGDVLKITDTVSNAIHNAENEFKKRFDSAFTGEIINHFDCDLSDFREYLRDREEWNRKQAEAVPRWIPVTERLPEEHISPMTLDWMVYPCVFVSANEEREVRYYKFGNGHFWNGPGQMDEYITHWAEPMKLPQPIARYRICDGEYDTRDNG